MNVQRCFFSHRLSARLHYSKGNHLWLLSQGLMTGEHGADVAKNERSKNVFVSVLRLRRRPRHPMLFVTKPCHAFYRPAKSAP